MKPRDYCCCAIPVVNAGIYAVLLEQAVLGFVAGTLAISTPHIVGAATFSGARWIFAIICYVAAAVQALGFIGVFKEKPIVFRRYVSLHIIATLAAFSVGAVWTVISATRHSTAVTRCETDFFPSNSNNQTASEGETLCNIFPWVDVGIMGGMLVFFGIAQTYFFTVISSYGKSQRHDHKKYLEVYNSAKQLNTDIPLTTRGGTYESPSSDRENPSPGNYGHVREDSEASVSDVLSERMQTHRDAFSDGGYGYAQPDYSRPPTSSDVSHPSHAYPQEPGPTPYNENYYTGANSYGNQYMASQSRPTEGSFHRKGPQNANSNTNEYGDARYK